MDAGNELQFPNISPTNSMPSNGGSLNKLVNLPPSKQVVSSTNTENDSEFVFISKPEPKYAVAHRLAIIKITVKMPADPLLGGQLDLSLWKKGNSFSLLGLESFSVLNSISIAIEAISLRFSSSGQRNELKFR